MKQEKNINIEISHDLWKKLKILSVHRDMHLQEVIRKILEKGVIGVKVENVIEE